VQEEDIRNFNHIADEIKRQYDVVLRLDDSLDTKTGIILGFIFLVIVQITLNVDFIHLVEKGVLHFTIFAVGLSFIVYSVYSGIRAYFIREYGLGPEILDLIAQYENGEKREFVKVISREISDSLSSNMDILQKKAKYAKRMIPTFFIGVLSIIIIEITYLSKIW